MPPRTKRGRVIRDTTPPTPPPPPPEVESEDDEVAIDGTRAISSGFYLDVEDLGPIEGNTILENLQYLGWLKFVKYNGPYYQNAIYQFYANCDLNGDDDNPSIPFEINGTKGTISCLDLVEHFDMPVTYHETDLSVLDYPKKGWSYNWPFDYDECVEALNNGREGIRDGKPSKLNLTGYQRLAFKLVIESLLPANNKATEITYVQTLLVMAIMRRERINLPSLIIKHMVHSSAREILPYGMILSHLFFQKGVDFGLEVALQVSPNARINRASLKAQEIYEWRGKLWSKWEVFHYFELDLDNIWKQNGLKHPPRIPANLLRCGHNRDPPNLEDLAIEGEGAGNESSSRQHASRVPPRRRGGDRDLLEAIQASMQSMQVEQQRQGSLLDTIQAEQMRHSDELRAYHDYQWRQTAMFQAMSINMGIGDQFDNIFHGYPTTAPHPPQHPINPPDDPANEGDI